MKKSIVCFLFIFSLFQGFSLYAEEKEEPQYKHSLDFSPFSPLFEIYALQYGYHLSSHDELILGAAYMNIHFDMGHTNSGSLILGYRRYLWKKLHIEYQIWPTADHFYEKNEGGYYDSFDIWNEFRLGYRFDFTISGLPFYVNIQWPFGFGLYASNKPESFKEHERENRFFYFPPIVYLGMRF
jgi:hypothetical protein